MLRPTRSSAAYRYPLRRTGFRQHYLLDYDAYDTVGNTQKSTLSGAFLHVCPGSLAELCEHGLADLVHIADDAVGAVVEDRRLGIGVHGDDHVRVRKARDVVDRARHAERQQQLRLDHSAGLPDDELERQHAAVEHRARAGDLAAEALCQTAVARQGVRPLDRVADADDHVRVRDVQALVEIVGAEIENLGADVRDREVDVLLDDLVRTRAAGHTLERARADRADLRARHRHGDDGHHLAADGRLNELDVRRLGIPDELGRVRSAAGAKARGEARRKVAPVDRAADHDRRGPVLPAQDGEEVGVRIVIEVVIARAGHVDDLVHAAVEHALQLSVRDAADDDRDEFLAARVAELARFRAQLERDRQHAVAVALDEDPHVFVICLIHCLHLLKARPRSDRRAGPRSFPCCPRRSCCPSRRPPAGRCAALSWASRGRRSARGRAPGWWPRCRPQWARCARPSSASGSGCGGGSSPSRP